MCVQHKEYVLLKNPHTGMHQMSKDRRNVYYHATLDCLRQKYLAFQLLTCWKVCREVWSKFTPSPSWLYGTFLLNCPILPSMHAFMHACLFTLLVCFTWNSLCWIYDAVSYVCCTLTYVPFEAYSCSSKLSLCILFKPRLVNVAWFRNKQGIACFQLSVLSISSCSSCL